MRLGAISADTGTAVAADGVGNVFATGSFSGTVDFGGGPFTSTAFPWLDPNNFADVFVAKYSGTNHQHLWSRQIGAEAQDYGRAVTTDPSGNVFVTGSVQNYVDFGDGIYTPAGGSDDAFVAKYAGSDGSYLWAKHFTNGLNDRGLGVAADQNGSVFITGEFEGDLNLGGATLSTSGRDDFDVFVAKYAADGTYLWSTQFGDIRPDGGNAVTVDPWGDIIVTGHFQGTVDFGGGPLTSAGGLGNDDVFVAKFSGFDGRHLWSKRFGNTARDVGNSVAVDQGGNVVVTGAFQGAVDFGGGLLSTSAITDCDGFLVALSGTSGSHLWSRRFGNTGNDAGNSVAAGAGDAVLVAGRFNLTVDFGGGLLSAVSTDAFVAKYSALDGTYKWARNSAGALPDQANGCALDPFGNAVATGNFFSTVKFGGPSLTSAGSTDSFIVRLGP
jgi:hypothetical protein